MIMYYRNIVVYYNRSTYQEGLSSALHLQGMSVSKPCAVGGEASKAKSLPAGALT